MKSILGKGKTGLFDTRPAERASGSGGAQGTGDPAQRRRTTWTDFYAAEDSYSRVDYILISQGMERDWRGEETYVLNLPDWGAASDHRPLVAGFVAAGK
jgi:endonuclease/exonuclease/phosphatase family metal-dependent hydrolase